MILCKCDVIICARWRNIVVIMKCEVIMLRHFMMLGWFWSQMLCMFWNVGSNVGDNLKCDEIMCTNSKMGSNNVMMSNVVSIIWDDVSNVAHNLRWGIKCCTLFDVGVRMLMKKSFVSEVKLHDLMFWVAPKSKVKVCNLGWLPDLGSKNVIWHRMLGWQPNNVRMFGGFGWSRARMCVM